MYTSNLIHFFQEQIHSKDLTYEYERFHKPNVNNNINDLESLQMNYDENISELKEKLQISRDLRKKK